MIQNTEATKGGLSSREAAVSEGLLSRLKLKWHNVVVHKNILRDCVKHVATLGGTELHHSS